MKKLYYLIILTVILGLVLTGCFLSNVGQVPTSPQSGTSYLTKGIGMTVVSSTSTSITGVYNKAGGVSTFVDLSGAPILAVAAWEPKSYPTGYPTEPPEATNSTWDLGMPLTSPLRNSTNADWIWETHLAEGPADYELSSLLYDADAAKWGRVVLFETTFEISGDPTSAKLHIAADNGYEAWVNDGTTHFYSTRVSGDGWEDSDLHEASLKTDGWQYDGNFTINSSEFFNGSNTLYVLAGNEYFWTDDSNSPVPPTQSSPPYAQYAQYNPGAVIFQLDIDYEVVIEEAPVIAIEKSGPASAHVGDTITYNYNVTNTGDVPLSDIAVTDSLGITVSYVSGDDSNGLLDVGETWIFTANYEVPSGLDPVVNIATAYGTSPQATQVTDDDDWSVDILNPEILVEKSANTEVAAPGDTVTYSYTVTNTGDCILYDVSLEDDVVGPITLDGLTDEDIDGELDDLDVGASATGSAGYTVTFDDPEWLINIATGEGTDELDLTVYDEASCTVHTMGARTIGYWKTHSDDWCTLPEGSMFYAVDMAILITYFPGNGIEEDGVNPLEMLRVQLLAAELNVACFDDDFDYSRYEDCDIFDCIADAETFLAGLSDDLNTYWSGLGKAGQREFRKEYADELALKDCLEAFNAMGDEIFE